MIRAFKLLLVVLCLIGSFLLLWTAKRIGKPALRDRLSCACFKAVLRIVGVRLAVQGEVSSSRPLLVVSNHLSYLDIVILGSAFPFRFVAKKEIASWPGIAACCRSTDVIFIERRPEELPKSMSQVEEALAKGEVVCFFPEATTGSGPKVLPFKSGFFRLAETGVGGRELSVQPAAVAYTHLCGLPIDSNQWPSIAWYGDMELVPHIWDLLKLGRIDAKLILLPPAAIKEHENRKRLAAHCEQAVAEAILRAREESRRQD